MNKKQKILINLDKSYEIINNNLILNKITTSVGDIIYIDNFLKKPEIFVNFLNNKKNLNYFDKNITGYPGIKSKLNDNLSKEFDKFNLYIINPLLYKDFNKYKLFSSEYHFSIVNYLNSELGVGNIFPHNDCIKYNNFKYSGIASVLYLFDKNEKYNGTSIYKPIEKITGYLLNKEGFNDSPNLIEKINYLKYLFLNKCYNADEKEYFHKKIYSVDAKYNRIAFYKTSVHHNADINKIFFNNKNKIDNLRYTITSKIYFINKMNLDFYDVDKTFLDKYDKNGKLYISDEKIILLNKYLKKCNKNVMIKLPSHYY